MQCFYVLATVVALVSGQLVREDLPDHPLARCNDDSPATYYHTNVDADEAATYPGYVIFLQGGGLCVDFAQCRTRCLGGINPLCSANMSPIMAEGGGIRSSDPDVNPPFHDYYQVYIPYCSSDLFVGSTDRDQGEDGGYSYRGYDIIVAVIESLKTVANIDREDATVIITGVSAGGAGAGFMCPVFDRDLELAKIWCIGDAAGIFPDIPCWGDGCENFQDYVMRGNDHWEGKLPEDFDIHNFWQDYEFPLFVGIHQYDSWFSNFWGVNWNNQAHRDAWEGGMIDSVDRIGVSDKAPEFGMFIPSCQGHGMITSNNWYNGVTAGRNQLTYVETLMRWMDPDREEDDDSHMSSDTHHCAGFNCNEAC